MPVLSENRVDAERGPDLCAAPNGVASGHDLDRAGRLALSAASRSRMLACHGSASGRGRPRTPPDQEEDFAHAHRRDRARRSARPGSGMDDHDARAFARGEPTAARRVGSGARPASRRSRRGSGRRDRRAQLQADEPAGRRARLRAASPRCAAPTTPWPRPSPCCASPSRRHSAPTQSCPTVRRSRCSSTTPTGARTPTAAT